MINLRHVRLASRALRKIRAYRSAHAIVMALKRWIDPRLPGGLIEEYTAVTVLGLPR